MKRGAVELIVELNGRFCRDTMSGVPPERMIASGRGEYEPMAPNDTLEGRQKNRRIEIMLVDKSLASEMTRRPVN